MNSAAAAATERRQRQDTKDEPNHRRDNCNFGKHVAGLGPEGALTSHSSEGTGQTASFASLNEDKENHEDRNENKEENENRLHEIRKLFRELSTTRVRHKAGETVNGAI